MTVFRSPHNPIIRPEDVKPSRPDFEVICAFNAGVTRLGDETLLLLRVAERPRNADPERRLVPIFDAETRQVVVKKFKTDAPGYDFSDSRGVGAPEGAYLTSLSHLRLARSRDGVHFEIAETPTLFPETEYEAYGVEDPRISLIEGVYYVNYTAVSSYGVCTAMAATRDFQSFERLGVIFCPENKDVEIFPERIGGKYYALHRPSSGAFGRPAIWLAESPDLLHWGGHRRVMGVRAGGWDSLRIGGSAVPFRTPEGWLEIYHGADERNRYCLGAALLDTREPWRVLARSRRPILEPEADYERNGFFGNVVFACGALCEEGKVKLYYGAADTYTAYAEIPLEAILAGLC